ncbi:MAG: hypothetical protein HYX53_08095 [Chloroflexi bacterium]|nr:hypothetical protein [Chloroflexota bacterium]
MKELTRRQEINRLMRERGMDYYWAKFAVDLSHGVHRGCIDPETDAYLRRGELPHEPAELAGRRSS